MENPKHTVRCGYDRLGSEYRYFYEASNPNRYASWLPEFAQHLPPGGRVLELGCADGIPTAQVLSRSFDYLGVDISPVQVELARRHVPEASFRVADMTDLRLEDDAFEGVVALYSIIHVPLEEQPALFQSVFRWLKQGGHFLCVLGADTWTGTEEGWIHPDVVMYWSHADGTTYRNWLEKAGYNVLEERRIPEGTAGHTLFLLRK